MLKKMFSLILTGALALSVSTFGGVAMEQPTQESGVGEIVDLHIISNDQDSSTFYSTIQPGDQDDVIEFMNKRGWTPGTTFFVGNKEYRVLDDYQVMYMGVDTSAQVNHITDNTRATTIPTVKGSLPYSGTYSIINYMYTSHYWIVGDTDSVASIGVTISADTVQTVKVDWMDGRNDESMGSKLYRFFGDNDIVNYVWAYGGEKFYLKFTNVATYGTTRIEGAFNVFVDQVDAVY